MAVFQTFSTRNKKKVKDVYIYDKIPSKFKGQLVNLLEASIGLNTILWDVIWRDVRKELGLIRNIVASPKAEIMDLLVSTSSQDLLDIIDISFFYIAYVLNEEVRKNYNLYNKYGITLLPNEAIEELNQRFLEHDLGYQFNDKMLFRIDSQYTHTQFVIPALHLIYDEEFSGANEEFINAFSYFKKRNYEAAITEATKALESVLKLICERNNWEYEKTGAAKKLMQTLVNNKFFASYMDSYRNNLIGILEALPTIRNKESAHGKGDIKRNVTQHLASFALNQAATCILFLIQTYRDNQKISNVNEL